MLRFLPIMSLKERFEIENSIKYFLIQSWASIIFLIRFFFSNYLFTNINILIILRIFIKLGIIPFHRWFIRILKTSSIYILILLSSIQKLIPLIIINNLYIENNLIYVSIVLILIINVLLLPRTINLNKILSISSLNNLIWLLYRTITSVKLILIFIFIYTFLLIRLNIIYNYYNFNMFLQINSINFFDKVILRIIFISLGGIPPMLGFLIKFIILKIIFLYENLFIIILIIFSSLILLYYYLSRIYYFLVNIPRLKINFKVNIFFIKKVVYVISIIFFNIFIIIYL